MRNLSKNNKENLSIQNLMASAIIPKINHPQLSHASPSLGKLKTKIFSLLLLIITIIYSFTNLSITNSNFILNLRAKLPHLSSALSPVKLEKFSSAETFKIKSISSTNKTMILKMICPLSPSGAMAKCTAANFTL
jgi:hypothetical protein